MKLIFVHDNTFFYDNKTQQYYSDGNMTTKTWKRYLEVADSLTVIARSKNINTTSQIKQLSLASCTNVEFCIVPSISGPINMIKNRPKTIKMMKEQILNADAVIARLPSELGVLAAKIALKYNIKLMVEMVGDPWSALWTHGSVQGKIYAPISKRANQNVIKKARMVFYVTNEYLQKHYPTCGENIFLSDVEIQNIDQEILDKRISNISLKKNNSEWSIGLIGSLATNHKGVDTAIRAISRLREEGLNVRLQILGNGDEKKWIEYAIRYNIKDFVDFCGTLPSGNLVNEWLDEKDIYIQPSITEGLPRAVIEAMSRGCPIVASNVGGIPELIDVDFLIPPKNDFYLFVKLKSLINDKNIIMEQINKNFNESKKYQIETLNNKRREYLKKFLLEK